MASCPEISLCAFRVEREVELVFPTELITRLAQRVVAYLRTGMSFGKVGGVGGYLIGDNSYAHIFLVGQCKVLFGGDVAQHGRTQPTDLRRTDSRGDMVVARSDVRNQRPQR